MRSAHTHSLLMVKGGGIKSSKQKWLTDDVLEGPDAEVTMSQGLITLLEHPCTSTKLTHDLFA